MIDAELQRIGIIYGATPQDMDEVAKIAYAEPMVPISEIVAAVVARVPRRDRAP
jgi:hypothetical protein